MAGRIVLQDGVVTSRIILRCKLSAACYEVCHADGPADVARLAAEDGVVATIMDAGDSTDGITARLAAAGLPRPAGGVPLILLAEAGNPGLRIAGLAAGAAAVLERPVDEALLLATLRRLSRGTTGDAELMRQAKDTESFALCEAAEPFAPQPQICVVPAGSPQAAERIRNDLAGSVAARVSLRSVEDLLANGTGSDVVVLAAGAAQALRLIPELKSRAATRDAAILFSVDTAGPAEAEGATVGNGQLAAMALDLGADEVLPGGATAEETAFLVSRLLARKASADALRRRISAGLRLAARDPLTGLYNRRVAMPRLEQMLLRCGQENRPVAVMLVDLDRFKLVNDGYGHAVGDRVLVEVAARLAAAAGADDLVARIGGEEFLLACPGTALPAASMAATRISSALRDLPVRVPTITGGIRITASIGLAVRDPDLPGTAAGLIDEADRALLAAKSDGRDQITVARSAA